MGTVSDTSSGSLDDLQTIMTGGENFVARMVAFSKSKEDAEAAVKLAGIAGDILAKQSEVDAARSQANADRDAARAAAQRASSDAADVAAKAAADAAQVSTQAAAQAREIIHQAELRANELMAKAGDTLAAAQRDRADADAKILQAEAADRDMSSREAALKAAGDALKAAQDAHGARVARLQDALKNEVDG
jgi:hypothetical protein